LGMASQAKSPALQKSEGQGTRKLKPKARVTGTLAPQERLEADKY